MIHTRKNAFPDYHSSMKFLAVFKSQLHGTIRFGPLILTEYGETMNSKNKYLNIYALSDNDQNSTNA